jgi:TonB family protein
MSLRLRIFRALLSLALLTLTASAQTPDLTQQLQEKFANKIFALRGFYSNDQLSYDAAGDPVGSRSPGFWTIDGFVLITDVKASGQSVVLKGLRMPVISGKNGFQFQPDSPKKKDRMPGLKIEAKLGSGDRSQALDTLGAKIFMTEHDSLIALVPSYWRTCVSGGLNQVNDPKFARCQFSAELRSIPGMNAHADLRPVPQIGQSTGPEELMHVLKAGKDVSPPKVVSTQEPQFSSFARKINLQGVVTLLLIVDDHGLPQNIDILTPIGGGLDEQAVAAVATWNFKPAEQKGHGPVAVKIAVEVAFHL